MSDKTHFEVSKASTCKVIGLLTVAIISLVIYNYQDDEKITRASLKTNQEAIQRTLDGLKENEKGIAIGETRMDGHVVNPVAHTN